MGPEPKTCIELFFAFFFPKNLKQIITHLLPVFFVCSFASNAPRTFVTLQFAYLMTQKCLNLIKVCTSNDTKIAQFD
jgi:hypothetical protein